MLQGGLRGPWHRQDVRKGRHPLAADAQGTQVRPLWQGVRFHHQGREERLGPRRGERWLYQVWVVRVRVAEKQRKQPRNENPSQANPQPAFASSLNGFDSSKPRLDNINTQDLQPELPKREEKNLKTKKSLEGL